jgi:excisionase family DNA binding protein
MSLAELSTESLWTLSEVAAHLGLGKDHRDPISAVRFLCRSRKLRFVKVGRTLRFKREWVEQYIAAASIEPIRTASRSSGAL